MSETVGGRPSRIRRKPDRFQDNESTKKPKPKHPIDPLNPIGYARRLSDYHDYGNCGGSDVPDDAESLKIKISELSELIIKASHVAVHTGAGISTSAGIPDFRGEKGVWTRHMKGDPLPMSERCWNNAQPTFSHLALKSLVDSNLVHCVVTQNIDGLHRRSKMPEDRLAELHGNIFKEKCQKCQEVVTRTFDCGGVGFKPTGRTCPCGGAYIDQLLDWEDDLPTEDYDKAEEHAVKCEKPDGLAICLGTSMQMTPARDWPCRADKLVIVNLQPTVRDQMATLVIRAKIDDVMRMLISELNLSSQSIHVPPYYREESFKVVTRPVSPHKFKLTIDDGNGAPCGYILNIKVETSPDIVVTLDTQPFVYQAGKVLQSVLRLTVVFDKVPIGPSSFHTPPDQHIQIQVSPTEVTEQLFSVVLSPNPVSSNPSSSASSSSEH